MLGLFCKRAPDVSTIGSRLLEAPALMVRPTAPVYQALTNLPPFGPVVVSLMQTFDRDEAGPAEISRLIEADPSLASEVMACANSALFGMSTTVTTLTQAIMLLGLDRVRALSSVIALRTMMEGAPKAPPLRRCWKHSIACGLIARELAPAYQVSREQAYTAGILHDVGRLGLLACYPNKYGRLCCMMHENLSDILATETSWFQTNHCHAGLFLVSSWHLPKLFQVAVSLHHMRSNGHGIGPLMQMSCLLADALDLDAIRYKLPKQAAVLAMLPAEVRPQIEPKLAGIEQAVMNWIRAFDF